MDLIELARTIQADRNRVIAAETRRRRFITDPEQTPHAPAGVRSTAAVQRPASTGVPTR
jgi:hypothetical protein